MIPMLKTRPLASEDLALPEDRGDGWWKALTHEGNLAARAGAWDRAEVLHEDALIEAERLFALFLRRGSVVGADPAPMLVVATANLAETALRAGKPERAGILIAALCWRLTAVMEDPSVPRAARESCFTHCRLAALEALEKLPRVGWTDEAVRQEVARVHGVASRFIVEGETAH